MCSLVCFGIYAQPMVNWWFGSVVPRIPSRKRFLLPFARQHQNLRVARRLKVLMRDCTTSYEKNQCNKEAVANKVEVLAEPVVKPCKIVTPRNIAGDMEAANDSGWDRIQEEERSQTINPNHQLIIGWYAVVSMILFSPLQGCPWKWS